MYTKYQMERIGVIYVFCIIKMNDKSIKLEGKSSPTLSHITRKWSLQNSKLEKNFTTTRENVILTWIKQTLNSINNNWGYPR